MKGIVFTEFMEMVEGAFGGDTLDGIIDDAKLPNDGAYAATGTYDHQELVRMVVALSQRTGKPVPALVKAYGTYLFGRLAAGYPGFFPAGITAFRFLEGLDNYVHVEVRKLYPDAELPRFDSQPISPTQMRMVYKSSRHFADLAEGLLQGCFDHFGEKVGIARQDGASGPGSEVVFLLTRSAA